MGRKIAILVWLGAVMAAVAPAARAVDTTLTGLPGAAQSLTAYGGWVVWSARDAGAWYLTAWHDGQVARLPVAPRSTAFDADAGPDAQGRPTLVYSRCARDPGPSLFAPLPDWATGRGCRLYALTLAGGGERRLGGVLAGARSDSDYAPSIWGRQIAFARLGAGARTARILLYRPGAGLRRLAGGSPPCAHFMGTCSPARGHAGALAMDLGPHLLALTWLIAAPYPSGTQGEGTEMLAVPLDGRANTLADSGELVDGQYGYREPLSPGAVGAGVAYLLNSGPPDRGPGQNISSFQVLSLTGARQAAPPPSPPLLALAAARDGAATYWIGEPDPGSAFYRFGDCEGVPAACSLHRSDSIAYQPSPRRRGRPPVF